MENNFTTEELSFLLESVTYSKKTFEEYSYENSERRKEKITQAENMIVKIRALLKGA